MHVAAVFLIAWLTAVSATTSQVSVLQMTAFVSIEKASEYLKHPQYLKALLESQHNEVSEATPWLPLDATASGGMQGKQ
eukprot:15443-Heterococcus_DN1.PRE.5